MPLGVVWQPTATTRASKAMKVVFTTPEHTRPTAGVNGVGGGRERAFGVREQAFGVREQAFGGREQAFGMQEPS